MAKNTLVKTLDQIIGQPINEKDALTIEDVVISIKKNGRLSS